MTIENIKIISTTVTIICMLFITLLNPFAPHMCEELNKEVLGADSLVFASWPKYDEAKTVEDSPGYAYTFQPGAAFVHSTTISGEVHH